ncbi:hypothetical protein ACTFIW_003824 [Dictyostelium discoideum]
MNISEYLIHNGNVVRADINTKVFHYYNTDLPNLEISNLVSDDSSSSSSSSSSHVSSSTGNIPRSIDQTIRRVNTNPNSTTLETGDYSIFQSHNQTDIVNDPFITRIMTCIHKLRPSSAKYQEIWNANRVFKHLSTIKVIPKYTYTSKE